MADGVVDIPDRWVTVVHQPAQKYLDMMVRRDPFALVRIGDGEREAMFRDHLSRRTNVDGCSYRRDVQELLREVVARSHERFFLCSLLRPEFSKIDRLFFEWVDGVCGQDKVWYDGDVFQLLSHAGQIQKLFDVLETLRVTLVGGSHLEKLRAIPALRKMEHVETSLTDAIIDAAAVLPMVRRRMRVGVDVIGFSAGFASKIWIDQLFEEAQMRGITLVDFGSLFDPYCGVLSRAEMKAKGLPFFMKSAGLLR